MKKTTKDIKGITLIALIITVIIMLILVSTITYTGLNTYKNTKVSEFVFQMQLIQAKIDELFKKGEIDIIIQELEKPGDKEQSIISTAFSNKEISSNDMDSYRVLTKEQILEILDVDDMQNSIIVNIKTREILDSNGIEYNGKKYYTQYNLPNGQILENKANSSRELGDFTVETQLNGLNCNVIIKDLNATNATLSLKENNTEEVIITSYTETKKEYTTNISKSGTYSFILRDNTNPESYVEKQITVKVTNKPKTNLDLEPYNYTESSKLWAYVQKDGINYVWIPRFAWKKDNDTSPLEIKFIKGNSNISTDNVYINEKEWTIPSKFDKNDGTKLTGLWIKVDNANQEGLDMINILNSDVQTLTEI